MKEDMMAVYLQRSPSERIINKKFLALRSALFHHRLKLPLMLFQGKSILEFGSGTGETTHCYALWGGVVDCVELNKVSCEKLTKLFQDSSLDEYLLGVHNVDFDHFTPNQQYDFCCAEGCLHLADNPLQAFNNLISGLRPGGIVVIAVPETLGHFQEFLKRYLLYKLSDKKDNVVHNAKTIFAEVLNRASKAGGRSVESIVFDKYLNRNIRSLPATEVLKWFQENNITYYNSWPNLLSFKLNDTHYQQPLDLCISPAKDLVVLSKLFLSKTRDYDHDRIKKKSYQLKELNSLIEEVEKCTADADLYNILDKDLNKLEQIFTQLESLPYDSIVAPEVEAGKQFSMFMREAKEFISFLKSNYSLSEAVEKYTESSILFRGFTGNPSQYYVGYKQVTV